MKNISHGVNALQLSFPRSFQAMLLTALVVTLTASAGCRNCRNNCGQPFAGAYGGAPAYNVPGAVPGYGAAGYGAAGYGAPAGVAGNSATIAPPATYSLNIPGGVNPYAQGTRVGQLPAGLINTRQPAPTPASGTNSPANFNQQQGWRKINGGNLNTQSNLINPAAAGPVATSVLDRSPDSSAPANQPNQFNQSNPPQINNVATTRSTDYRTTAVDERRDATRLPLTDASAMQPRVAQTLVSPVTQPYYNRTSGGPSGPTGQPQSNRLASRGVFQGQFSQPVNSAYQGQFLNPVGSVGGPFAAPLAQPQLVQTQSTATYDPYTATASDWRSRGRDSRSY